MSTIIIAITMLVFITLIVALLMFVHDRDKKKEAAKKWKLPEHRISPDCINTTKHKKYRLALRASRTQDRQDYRIHRMNTS